MVRASLTLWVIAAVLAVAAGACASSGGLGGTDPPTPPPTLAGDTPTPSPTFASETPGPTPLVRVVLVGDIMLGRGVAPIAAADPEGLFEAVRHVIKAADVAGGNLESPLTTRPHIATNPNDLTADPSTAQLLASAGFDLMSVANNHSGDAGPESVVDTVAAVETVEMVAVGGGADLDDALTPRVIEHDGIRLAFLAFDATQAGWPAGSSSPGIAHWDDETVRSAVTTANAAADLVIVSVHGGIEYLLDTDPAMADMASQLARWGADVVWGHGSHVLQPVYLEGDSVVATSLGNFVFDQGRGVTELGGVLEVLADAEGAVAFRVGHASHPDGRVRFEAWALPTDDAVLLGSEWWAPVRTVRAIRPEVVRVGGFTLGAVTASSLGDATGDGVDDVVVSYRHTRRPHAVRDAFPDHLWTDVFGRTAHLGVFTTDDHTPLWVGGAMFRPVAAVAACDGAVALAFDSLDDATTVATSAWRWNGFGFDIPPELPGPGTLGCADLDGDGRLDPLIAR